jgi:hypothetical protein
MAKDKPTGGQNFIIEIDLSEFSYQMTNDGKVIIYVNSWGNSVPIRTRKVFEDKGLSYGNLAVGDRGGLGMFHGNYNYHNRPLDKW